MNWAAFGAAAAVNAALWLVMWIYVRRAFKKLNKPQQAAEKETRVFKLYQEIEGMLDSFDQYVDEVRGEIEDERAALQELSRQAQVVFLQAMEKAAALERKPPEQAAPFLPAEPAAVYIPSGQRPAKNGHSPPNALPNPAVSAPDPRIPRFGQDGLPMEPPRNSRLTDRERITLSKLENKSKRVRFLMSRGFAVDETARELGIGIGEVRLIADLDK